MIIVQTFTYIIITYAPADNVNPCACATNTQQHVTNMADPSRFIITSRGRMKFASSERMPSLCLEPSRRKGKAAELEFENELEN